MHHRYHQSYTELIKLLPHALQFTTKRLGEPLNLIISSLSDPYILTESGLHTYAKYTSPFPPPPLSLPLFPFLANPNNPHTGP